MKPNKLKVTAILAITFAFAIIFSGAVAAADDTSANPTTDIATLTPTVTPENQTDPADLAVVKKVDNSTPLIGQTIQYTIVAENNGPDPAPWVWVYDPLPAGVTYLDSTTTQGIYDHNSGWWLVGWLNPGHFAQLVIDATVNAKPTTPTVTNCASIKDYTFPWCVHDPNWSNNFDSATFQEPVADVQLCKTTSNSSPNVGQEFNYTITATNNGPQTATNVVVTDKVPTGLTYNGYTASQGTYNPTTGVWTVGTLLNCASAWLKLCVTPTACVAGTCVTNVACKTCEDQYDPTTPDTASVKVYVPEADVQLCKTTSNCTPNVGEEFYYTVTATNCGPDCATGVQVTDKIPSCLTFNCYQASQGTYDSITGLWNVGTILNGANAWLKIFVTPTADAAGNWICNTATKTAQCEYDPTTPDTASADVYVPACDLKITKTVDNTHPCKWSTVNYTITVKNCGPDTAVNVSVCDKLASGLKFLSYCATQGVYDSTTGIWCVGDIADGCNAVLNINAKVEKCGSICNTATVDSDTYNLGDPNSDSVTIHVKENRHHHDGRDNHKHNCNHGDNNTVPMQDTGAPFVPFVIGALSLLAGFGAARRK